MAKLADIQYAMHGEQPKVQKNAPNNPSGVIHYDPKNPPAPKQFHIFKLVKSNKKGGVHLSNIDDIYNPKTGRRERARYLRGRTTIWLSEQKDITEAQARNETRSISFPRGVRMLRVRNDEEQLLEFLRLNNANIGNPHRIPGNYAEFEFYEFDMNAAEKEAFEKENFELEMALTAKTTKLEEMRKHAAFLGISLINELGEAKTEDGIRREYVIYAKRNPVYFQRTMKSEQVEASWLVRKAIADGFIDTSREKGKVYWAKDGGLISAMPPQIDAQTYLTDLFMTNTEEGIKFKERLKKIVT